MDTNILILLLILFIIADKFFTNEDKKEGVDTTMVQVLAAMKLSAENSTTVSFEETKAVMNTMIDEYLDHMYTMENDRPFLIKDKDFPTEWGGIYIYPSEDAQRDQIRRLKESVRKNSSETFMNRIRVFYTDSYIDEYLDKTIEEKYIRRREESDTKFREFKQLCIDNREKIRKDNELAEKKVTAEKYKRINKLLSTFSHAEYLPEDLNEIGIADRVDGVDTHKLLQSRYVLNKKYYDELGTGINNEADVLTSPERYKRVDDKLIAFMAKEFEWQGIEDNPHIVEEHKHQLVEISMRYDLNPLDDDLFGAHDSPPNITENYKGKTYDMSGKKLNNIFYFEDTYEKGYGTINEAAITENIAGIYV